MKVGMEGRGQSCEIRRWYPGQGVVMDGMWGTGVRGVLTATSGVLNSL